MNGPDKEKFQEAYDQFCFERSLEEGEICSHGYLIGECSEHALWEKEAFDEGI